MTLVLRKLLASSTFAIAGTLNSLINKLKARLRDATIQKEPEDVDEELAEDFEALDEIRDEWTEDEEAVEKEKEELSEEDIRAIEKEIGDLEAFYDIAQSITNNAKGESLLQALKYGFAKARELGADEKALIFTESRRTQSYLFELLEDTNYSGKIVLFNGSNNDEKSKEIYREWLEKHRGTDRVTGSRTADIRAAIVDYFREEAVIMIATESAAEGINLQFCSQVVNYDLPWNPQRVEQRIGRCHRYGQQHDVVVVNFLNKNNAADQRVYQILSEKFKLFSGVFGASDEVLGSIESGMDFEKRIARIYQECRTSEAIQLSFDDLQTELEEQISDRLKSTRKKLLENFDEEVHEKLRVNLRESEEYLSRYEHWLWEITRHFLTPYADFKGDRNAFRLNENPFPDTSIPVGLYRLGKNVEDAHIYRIGHPLARNIIDRIKGKSLPKAEVTFDYSGSPKKISILEPLVGQSGYLSVNSLTVSALEAEDYLVFSGVTDGSHKLDDEVCRRLFSLSGVVKAENIGVSCAGVLDEAFIRRKAEIIDNIAQRDAVFFDEEMDKLDKWADDKKGSLRIRIKDLDKEIKELKREARLARNLPEKLSVQKKIRSLDSKRDEAWRQYDKAAREVEQRKDELIDSVEARLQQQVTEEAVFTIRWKLT
jgi:hypothetical protein